MRLQVMVLQIRIQRALRRYGKDAFVANLPNKAKIFDIGCGNMSPRRVKLLRPDIHYIGLDIQDYNQNPSTLVFANEYRVCQPEYFVSEIQNEQGSMDAVISSHNLEHCADQREVLHAMCQSLKFGGKLYLSFPSEASVYFPSRAGTLRFSDDPTHNSPPNWYEILDFLNQSGLIVIFARKRYRPFIPMIIGGILEPLSFISKYVMPFGSTWALWGFESVIWAEKPNLVNNIDR